MIRRVPKSIADTLAPGSWVPIGLGALSIFNTVAMQLDIPALRPLDLLNHAYAAARDTAFRPLDLIAPFPLHAWVKNLIVLYLTLGRSFSASVKLIRKELATRPDADPQFRTVSKEYPPFSQGRLRAILHRVAAVERFAPAPLRPLASILAMTAASVLWPFALPQMLAQPSVETVARGAEKPGQPHPSNPRITELPPLDNEGGYRSSPKFPGEGTIRSGLYDTRVIVATLIAAQICLSAIFVALSYLAGPYLPR